MILLFLVSVMAIKSHGLNPADKGWPFNCSHTHTHPAGWGGESVKGKTSGLR